LPPLVDNAARLLGFPVGPLQLMDETSLDLGARIAKATKAAMGDDYPDDAVDEVVFWMVEEGRLGRKANAGFFDYDAAGKRQGYWPGLAEKYPPADDQPDLTEVKNRLMMAQVLEAVRAFDSGVLTDIREGDVGAILGWGFAPWSGGPFSWLDMLGAARAVEICDDLKARHGAALRRAADAARHGREGRDLLRQRGKSRRLTAQAAQAKRKGSAPAGALLSFAARPPRASGIKATGVLPPLVRLCVPHEPSSRWAGRRARRARRKGKPRRCRASRPAPALHLAEKHATTPRGTGPTAAPW
jgi:3-hydroxyacyl-CoA dehydrogenase